MWVKLDDHFFQHPKILRATPEAKLLYLAGLTWCAANLTDGLIPAAALPVLAAEAGIDPAGPGRLPSSCLSSACGLLPTRPRETTGCTTSWSTTPPAPASWPPVRPAPTPVVRAAAPPETPETRLQIPKTGPRRAPWRRSRAKRKQSRSTLLPRCFAMAQAKPNPVPVPVPVR